MWMEMLWLASRSAQVRLPHHSPKNLAVCRRTEPAPKLLFQDDAYISGDALHDSKSQKLLEYDSLATDFKAVRLYVCLGLMADFQALYVSVNAGAR